MKKYVLSIAILLTAIAAFSFTNQKSSFQKELLSQPGRQRFCMMLDCTSQNINRNRVFDPANYTQTECPAVECDGSECVCAIYAFPDGTTGKPIINASSDYALYEQLSDFAADGIWDNPHGWVTLKNEIE